MFYSFEEFKLLNKEEKIDYACCYEPIAYRETPLQWFYIVYAVNGFYVELKFDNFSSDRLALDVKAIKPASFKHYLKNSFYCLNGLN